MVFNAFKKLLKNNSEEIVVETSEPREAVNNSQYALYQNKKNKLVGLIGDAEEIFKQLGMKGWIDNSQRAFDKVESDRFKVIVIGEFKRGKSTFINALLGEEVLPAFATPCTAVINEVKWADNKKAVLHFKNPLPENIEYSFKSEVKKHIESAKKSGAIPSMSIDVNELEDYVVIPDPAKDQDQSVSESPYSKVELFYPLELCKNGVEIIDSPGLNEHGTRTKVTTDYLTEVDAVLFVMSCQALASKSEMDFIENRIKGAGHEEIFFICNRFDEVREREKERVIAYANSKLSPHTKFKESGIHFISAADAMDGRLENKTELIENSQIISFEEKLAEFLINERGKIKLSQPAREIVAGLTEVEKEIPEQLKMIESSIEEIEKRYKEALPQLQDAEHRKTQIMQKIQNSRQRLKSEIITKTQLKITQISDECIKWVEEYEPEKKIKFVSTDGTKKQIEELSKEIAMYLSSKLEEDFGKWQHDTFPPIINQNLQDMAEGVDSSINQLINDIKNLKAKISGISINEDNLQSDNVSGVERVLAAAGGFVIGGAGSALVGATMGTKEMLKSLAPNIGIAVGMIMLGFTNPLTIIPALLAAGVLQGLLKTSSMTKEIKKNIASEFSKKLKNDAFASANKVGDEVIEKTEIISAKINQGLQKTINSVKEQVDAVLMEKRKGETEVAKRKKELSMIASKASEINSNLLELINDLSATC